MKKINNYFILFLSILLLNGCEECEEVFATAVGDSMDSEFCGWTVSTHYGGMTDPSNPNNIIQNPDASVGVLYDTRQNQTAPNGGDWGTTVPSMRPTNWTVANIGQVFGIATDSNNNIFLASSDIYSRNNWGTKSLESGNNNRPSSCTQIYKCYPPSYIPEPFASLPSNCEALNGIGNIAYDYVNNQLFASNLEDGKIYRISASGLVEDSYDPWMADNQAVGIAPQDERVWGIGVNVEDGVSKLYFAKNNLGSQVMYSIDLVDGLFPVQGSERVVTNIQGANSANIISDIAFSIDGSTMICAEYGNINQSSVISFQNSNGVWSQSAAQYYVGENIDRDGANTAGGVDFGPMNDGADASGECDQLVWATGKYLNANSVTGEIAGLQSFDVLGNNSYDASSPSSNSATDIFIDLDGLYANPCDLSNSLIVNAGFEDLVNPNDPPNGLAQLSKAQNWVQATAATSDFFYASNYNGEGTFTMPPLPNGSNGYAGTFFEALSWVEYVGACLSDPILANTEHSFSLLVGAPGASGFTSPLIDIDLVLLGIPTCSFPISGSECKEGQYDELARIPLNLPELTWETVEATFTPTANYDAIMFGLSCTSTNPQYPMYYLLVDDIIINQGEPCNGMEGITDYPGDVELFKCEGCFGPEALNAYIN